MVRFNFTDFYDMLSIMELIAQQIQPLLDFLSEKYPDSSKSTLRNWISHGRVEIDGRLALRASVAIMPGQVVRIGPRVKSAGKELQILYEDRDLIVIDKPAGLLSVGTDFDLESSAHFLLKRRFHRPRIIPVHRLDRETSGLLVFAYSEAARVGLKMQFEKHSIERQYRALVHGILPQERGTFQSYLQEDARYFVRSSNANRGKLAITHYVVIGQNDKQSSLKLFLETGRKNQIRVHLSEAGYPVVGDRKYGKEHDEAPRLCLHASELGFMHPVSHKRLYFRSPCPF